MSYVVFCKGQDAGEAYVMGEPKIHLYTMEELCYYIYRNRTLCDKELLNPALADWIRDECKLADLASSLREIYRTEPKAEKIAEQIFAYMDFLKKMDREAVCEIIRKSALLSMNERRKSRADQFFVEEEYRNAAMEYEKLLANANYDNEKAKHNMMYNVGCCYARFFYYDIAAKWFLDAARMGIRSHDDFVLFLLCKRKSLKEEEFRLFMMEHPELKEYVEPMEKYLGAGMMTVIGTHSEKAVPVDEEEWIRKQLSIWKKKIR
ncbi:MAG: hypothetical protein K6G07_01415 [Lachnospiraceae bacterium]|nr:hypothetical protein [Lachnospiraceae bacterium]